MNITILFAGVIPALKYGGTERVIWALGKALVAMGHHVTYLVGAGSSCPFANVLFIDPNHSIVGQIPDGCDIVHFHSNFENLDGFEKPYVITIHGNARDSRLFNKNSIFVSKSHAERFGSSEFVHNGLDWDEYLKPVLSNNRAYFHFLGKAAWRVKNVNGAIDIVKKTREEKIKIIGGHRFNFSMGLRFTLTPRASFCGMLGGGDKDAMINGSKGLIFPVRWHEPFGLAIIESLFFGCPVFGTPYGSLPEIVSSDVGFLSVSRLELSEAILNGNDYSRRRCHDYAFEMFNSIKMAKSYLEKYERVLNGCSLNPVFPFLRERYTGLLDWRD